MRIRIFVMFLLVMILCAYRFRDERVFHINGLAQGTTYHISYWAADSVVSQQEIEQVLSQLDSSLSIYKPFSLISRFNHATNGIKLDVHLTKVVEKALQIYYETQGKFDITVYPLVNAWGFANKKIERLPDSLEIQRLIGCVGGDKLRLDKGFLKKASPCVKIDVNGIAQGYSVDVLADFLSKKGIRNYLVEIGGEIVVAGKKPNGEGMNIGIESPAENNTLEPLISKIITIENAAVTTSGNYRKYLENGQQRLPHLIDPKTGYPIKSEMVSVTVVAKDAITADGYDNALMAMTVSEAIAFADRKSLAAHFIYHKSDGRLADTATHSFSKLLRSPIKGDR